VLPASAGLSILAVIAYAMMYLLVTSLALVNMDWLHGPQSAPMSEGSQSILLLMVAVSPIFEETITRAYFMTRLNDLGFGTISGVLASTLLQTSYHIHKGLVLVPGYAVIFFMFSLYFARYRNLPVLILAHLYIDLVWWILQ